MPKKIVYSIILITGLLSHVFTHAGDYQPLEGGFMVGGATLIDPSPQAPRNTHYYIQLTGKSAEELYRLIDASAQYDECLDDGSMTKQQGAIQCTVSQDKVSHTCYFAIDVNRQILASGAGC
ncbi:MAG: hypothetical protein U5O69_02230 [Candidatus Competibacteraceae bacterium]|nr:hypothetical protein [Candidatus Competibacteraceae bacterium]